jgi:hypothetical protein
MKSIIKLTGLLIITIFTSSLSAQTADCSIKKSFPAPQGTNLRIFNKYGDIKFISNNSDSVAVCASISIEQENKELELKNMKFITVTIQKLNDTVTVTTNFDKSFFAETYRKDRKSFSVDILIKAPRFINADITNEFGNITAEEFSGKIKVRLSYGVVSLLKLTRGNNNPLNSINIDNGKVNIADVNWLSATIHNCTSVDIGKVQALLIESEFSKIRIGSVSSVVADSKSDIYTIDDLKNIMSESLYTSLKIDRFYGKMLSRLNYGSLSIASIQKDFGNIDIKSANASLEISTGNAVSFRPDIVSTGTTVSLGTKYQPGIIRKEGKNSVSFTGIYGDNPKTESVIRIRSESGKVTIR